MELSVIPPLPSRAPSNYWDSKETTLGKCEKPDSRRLVVCSGGRKEPEDEKSST